MRKSSSEIPPEIGMRVRLMNVNNDLEKEKIITSIGSEQYGTLSLVFSDRSYGNIILWNSGRYMMIDQIKTNRFKRIAETLGLLEKI